MSDKKLYDYLAQFFMRGHFVRPSVTCQSARFAGLMALVAMLAASPARAQSSASVAVQATVVNVAPQQRAMASARWLLVRRAPQRKERGLATVEVNRERRKVLINYLRN